MAGETRSLTGQFVVETHRVLEHAQNHPSGNQHQKGPICLWVAEEGTESWLRAKPAASFPLRLLPHIQHNNKAARVPGKYLRLHLLLRNRHAKTKKI